MSEELKPCLKCKNNDVTLFPVDSQGKRWSVSCDSPYKVCDFEITCTDRYLLAELWNTRTAPQNEKEW